jgi:hypothetical protein
MTKSDISYIGIALNSQSTTGTEGIAAVLLGTWYREIGIFSVIDEISKKLTPEQFPSLKDPEVGDMLVTCWPFLDNFEQWSSATAVGVYLKGLGYACNFKESITRKYAYGTWNHKVYNRLKMDLVTIFKKTDWFTKNRPDIEAALKKTRVVSKVMDS